MPTQTRTWQRKILEKAKADDYDDLYWYIETTAPGLRVFPAAYPGRWIPLVPVGLDPEASRRIAGMVAHFFRLSNPPGFVFAEQLTDTTALRGESCLWYEWDSGVRSDAICFVCAGVESVAHTAIEGDGLWVCEDCLVSNRWRHTGEELE